MNLDDDQDLEALLRGAALREPSPRLDDRLRQSLRPRRSIWPLRIAAMILLSIGIAALVQSRWLHLPVAHITPSTAKTQASSKSLARPLSIKHTYSQIAVDGIIARTSAGDPLSRVRAQTVQRVVVIDPATGRRVTMTLPREDVYLIREKAF